MSVVIPLFNKEQPIVTTLTSVLAQTRAPDELIIVDDGSSDGSVAAVERILDSSSTTIPVRIIKQQNQGVSVARNRGAGEARSSYIAFLDADDEWLPDCLAEFERLARTFPRAGVLTVRLAKVRPNGHLVPERSALPATFFGEVPNALQTYRGGYGMIHSSSVAIQRDAWQRSGGFPVGARNGEDICCWLKLMMFERMAHSGRALSIWHDEHSGVASRRGAVPHHVRYFLGTSEGRQYLEQADLVRFLGSNLVVQIGGRRLARDVAVVTELRRLSSALPLHFRIASFAAAIAPQWLLQAATYWSRARLRRFQPFGALHMDTADPPQSPAVQSNV